MPSHTTKTPKRQLSKQLQNTEHVVAVAANDYISAVEQQLDATIVLANKLC